MITFLMPHMGPHGPFAPMFFGGPLLLFLLVAGLGLLWLKRRRHGHPEGGLPWVKSPEQEAQTILAERFARGDISTEEFMERAAALNWTPGLRPEPPRQKGGPAR